MIALLLAKESIPWPIISSLAGIVVASGLTYLGVRWKSGGKIKATEAETLWAESGKLKDDYRQQMVEFRTEATGLRTRLESVHEELVSLRTTTLAIEREAILCREHVARLELQLVKVFAQMAEREERDGDAQGPSATTD